MLLHLFLDLGVTIDLSDFVLDLFKAAQEEVRVALLLD
jgi:hypothetical protein